MIAYNSSVYNPTLHIFLHKRYVAKGRVVYWTVLFVILVHCHFLLAADACLSWSLPSITEQQVSPHRLPMQYGLKNRSNTPCTPTSSAILCNNYNSLLSDLCACVHGKKNGIVKEAIVLHWVVWITSCDCKPGKKRSWAGALLSENAAVLCENHCERVITPNCNDDYQQEVLRSINSLNTECDTILVGDFHCPDINWSTISATTPFQ